MLCYLHLDKGVHHLRVSFDLMRDADLDLAWRCVEAGTVRPRRCLSRRFGRSQHCYATALPGLVAHEHLGNRVEFTGMNTDAEVAALSRSTRVVLLLYANVSRSRIASLALATATPVVACDLPGLHESLQDGAVLDPAARAKGVSRVVADNALQKQLPKRSLAVRELPSFDRLTPARLDVNWATVTAVPRDSRNAGAKPEDSLDPSTAGAPS